MSDILKEINQVSNSSSAACNGKIWSLQIKWNYSDYEKCHIFILRYDNWLRGCKREWKWILIKIRIKIHPKYIKTTTNNLMTIHVQHNGKYFNITGHIDNFTKKKSCSIIFRHQAIYMFFTK